ncbi:hypothetical protein ACFV27_34240 [Streptomyces antimycoticus]|uniref:hypothetical protein n=1 Tax=Streptomyces antimycoticus TaxID=68175 RepID=UPI00256FC4FD|nr:hypothetical protein [Streptomyces antimycoticus]WJE00677.1 hypothetical protein QR300_34495 [Streptomyces antimycoticus]
MLFLTRHMLNQHLMELPELVDRYAAHDAEFVDHSLSWLTAVEQTLLRLRHPLAGLVAGSRSEVLAVRDGYRERDASSRTAGVRHAQRATAALVLGRVEKTLRGVVDDIDTQLDGHREKMAQLLAVASNVKPIPACKSGPDGEWLRSLWGNMAQTKETAGMYAYLNAAISRSDVLTLLGEVLENLLATADQQADRAEIG